MGCGLLLLASLSPALPWSPLILGIAATAALAGARIPVGTWFRFLAPQMVFISIAVLPLLGFSQADVSRGLSIWLRGTAAAACLTLLSLTMQVPPSLVDQTVGQKCQYTLLGRMRLGLDIRLNGNRMRLAAVSLSAGNLLVRSLQAAQRLERGAALRGVEGLVMLPARTRTSAAFLSGAIVLEAVLAGAAWSLRGVFPW